MDAQWSDSERCVIVSSRSIRAIRFRVKIRTTTPVSFSEVADGVTSNGLGDCVSLLRGPDAEIRTSGSMSGVWNWKDGGASEARTDERVGHR